MLTRRRFIRITAATTAGALLPLAHAQTAAPAVKPTLWQGVALGSGAELRLYHPNPAVAQSLIKRSLDEVARLEKVFSLYRDDSQIQQLNRTGSLKNPSPDLLAVLSQSRYVHRLTQGAFDPTVQTLWHLYADWFSRHPNSQTPPPHLAQAVQHIGFQHVQFSSREVRFTRPKMGITLNGIAQGYITDRITTLLEKAGLVHALVDLGELHHLDPQHRHPERVSVRDPKDPNGTRSGWITKPSPHQAATAPILTPMASSPTCSTPKQAAAAPATKASACAPTKPPLPMPCPPPLP